MILFFPGLVIQAVTIVIFVTVIMLLLGFVALGFMGIFELMTGVAMVGVGIEKLLSIPMGAFSVMGFGIINIGIALLIECMVFWLFFVWIPAIIQKVTGKEVRHEKTS